MTPADVSNIPDNLNTHSILRILNLNLKLVIMLEMQINVTFSLKDTLVIGIENCLKLMKF